jgi:hypothetical protein
MFPNGAEGPAYVFGLRTALLARCRLQKVQMTDAKCFGKFVNCNDSWVTTSGLKTTNILLTESGEVAELFLRQPLFQPNTPNILTNQFAHIHAQRKIDYII